MHGESILYDLTVVVALGAVLAWVAHALKQPIILGYIVSGVLAGPDALGLVSHVEFVNAAGQVGVTLLLFLAGITLHPDRLVQLFRKTAWVTAVTSVASFAVAAAFSRLVHFAWSESLLIGAAMMFSSTILVIKLLPTTTLHQRHMGALCIAILIMQDIIAVALLLYLGPAGNTGWWSLPLLPIKLVALIGGAFLLEQYLIRKMMARIDRIHEALNMLAIGWCLGLAVLAHKIGLSAEVGAFIAGLALARSPLSLFLSEGLKPFRDFFLVLFFFVLGARLDLAMLQQLLLPAAGLASALLLLKPWLFAKVFERLGESRPFAREAGLRLGQASEFSLVIAAYAELSGALSERASQFTQLTAMITLAVSSYIVVLRCPTPVASSKKLQRD